MGWGELGEGGQFSVGKNVSIAGHHDVTGIQDLEAKSKPDMCVHGVLRSWQKHTRIHSLRVSTVCSSPDVPDIPVIRATRTCKTARPTAACNP